MHVAADDAGFPAADGFELLLAGTLASELCSREMPQIVKAESLDACRYTGRLEVLLIAILLASRRHCLRTTAR